MNNKVRFYIIDGVVLLAFLAISLAIPFAHTACFWISFILGVIAILIQIAILPLAFGGESPKSKFYGFPIARVDTIYLIAQLVLSILCMALAKWVPAFVPGVLGAVLLCAAVVGFITTDAIREEVEKQDVKVAEDVSVMRNLQARISSLSEMCENEETKKAVDKLAEEIKYSDPVSKEVTKELEMELYELVNSLRQAIIDSNDGEAGKLCKNTLAVLSERNNICKTNKK